MYYSRRETNGIANQEKVDFMATFLSWKYAYNVNERQNCLYLNFGVDNLHMAAPQIRRVILVGN